LNDSLFRSGLVDELHLTICPLIFGGRDAPTISGGDGCEHLSEAFSLKLVSRRRLGTELFCVFRQSPSRRKAR
jgi:riboflavin biosynthesis pyrimidine reductase